MGRDLIGPIVVFNDPLNTRPFAARIPWSSSTETDWWAASGVANVIVSDRALGVHVHHGGVTIRNAKNAKNAKNWQD